MELEKLRALFDLLVEKDIAEFEHEQGGVRVKVTRGARAVVASTTTGTVGLGALASPAASSVVPPQLGGGVAGPLPREGEPVSGDFVDITSPFVGSFYRSPSPDAPSFVEVGSVVRAGQTLCIIEAMKLMNEIEAECAGTIVEIFAQNGKSVEYGQKLFRIKKA
jgi:acetyl-CoA carboxylase biotin carboxyl carrier protein